MTQTQYFDADVAGVEPEGLKQFKFQGKEFDCQKPPTVDGTAMVEDGFELMLDTKIVVRLGLFTGGLKAPGVNDVIELDGVKYDIKTAEPDQYNVVINYGLKQST